MKVASLLNEGTKLLADIWLVKSKAVVTITTKTDTTFEPENRYSYDIMKFTEHNYGSSKDIFITASQ